MDAGLFHWPGRGVERGRVAECDPTEGSLSLNGAVREALSSALRHVGFPYPQLSACSVLSAWLPVLKPSDQCPQAVKAMGANMKEPYICIIFIYGRWEC